ncbi:MAG: hypothetical protein JSV26_09320 [bacterium]|nr:MAG: hypothetical protein JSV26_09320 [bacterium]
MNASVISQAQRGDWDRYMEENPLSIAWQAYEWSHLVRQHFGYRFFPLAAFEGDSIRGILPLYLVKRMGGGIRMMSVPHAVAGGILADGDDATACLLRKAIDLATECSATEVALKQYKVKVKGELKVDENYFNRELTLSAGIDDVWKHLSEANRDQIGSMDGSDLVLDHPSERVDEFYRLVLAHHHRRGIPCVSKRWIGDLIRFGMYSIAFLRKGDRVQAGTMVKTFKDTVSFPFTCLTGDDPRSAQAVYRLYWELIKKFTLGGYRIFHSGRIPQTEETDPYRLGWGGDKYPYYYQYYPKTVSQTEFSKKRGAKRKYFQTVWKVTPRPLVKALGPLIVRQFP